MTLDLHQCAGRLAALGQPARLSIVRLLLRAHPGGLVAGDLQRDLDLPASTLSHHLDTLLKHALIRQRREGKFLRYTADTAGLGGVLAFLLEECCARGAVVAPARLLRRLRSAPKTSESR